MITVSLRQFVIQTAFAAIKSLYGVQEKLSLEGYQHIEYAEDDEVDDYGYTATFVMAGTFYLKSQRGNYYKMRIDDCNEVTLLQRGKVSVEF